MRKVIFESSISLDGFIEGPGGELDWLQQGQDAVDISAFLSSFDTIFYGRKTYDKIGVPKRKDARMGSKEERFFLAVEGMRKYVFTRTMKHVEGNAMVIGDNLEVEVKRIREEEGKNIWLCGGADILRTFARFTGCWETAVRRTKDTLESKTCKQTKAEVRCVNTTIHSGKQAKHHLL
jgi:dihydrofolate reductase